MFFGSGVKHAIKEAAVWIFFLSAFSFSVAFHNDLVGMMSHLLQVAEDQYKQTFPEKVVADNGFEQRITIDSNRHGHYEIDAMINGTPARLLADTGATVVALTYETAKDLGISPKTLSFNRRTKTANGIAHVAPVTLNNISVGGITVDNVKAVVAKPGSLSVNLLGMSFIGQLSQVEMRHGKLILTQ